MPIVAGLVDLIPLVIAAAALLLAYAARDLLIRPISDLVRNLPFVGDAIGDTLRDWGGTLADATAAVFDRQVQSFTDMVDFVTGSIQYVLNTLSDGAAWVITFAQAAQKVAQDVTAGILSDLQGLQRDAQGIQRDAQRALDRVSALADRMVGSFRDGIIALIDAAAAGVRSFARGIQRDLQHALDDAIGALRAAITGLIASQLAGIRSWVSALIDGTRGLIADLGRELDARVHALEHEIAHGIDGLELDLDALRKAIGVIPIIGLVPWITSIADTLTRLERECVRPGCDYLGPQLDALSGIQDAATLALVAGLVAAAVQDPQGAARNIENVMSGADGLARAVFGETTGVHV